MVYITAAALHPLYCLSVCCPPSGWRCFRAWCGRCACSVMRRAVSLPVFILRCPSRPYSCVRTCVSRIALLLVRHACRCLPAHTAMLQSSSVLVHRGSQFWFARRCCADEHADGTARHHAARRTGRTACTSAWFCNARAGRRKKLNDAVCAHAHAPRTTSHAALPLLLRSFFSARS